jgi:hypothetical protein
LSCCDADNATLEKKAAECFFAFQASVKFLFGITDPTPFQLPTIPRLPLPLNVPTEEPKTPPPSAKESPKEEKTLNRTECIQTDGTVIEISSDDEAWEVHVDLVPPHRIQTPSSTQASSDYDDCN